MKPEGASGQGSCAAAAPNRDGQRSVRGRALWLMRVGVTVGLLAAVVVPVQWGAVIDALRTASLSLLALGLAAVTLGRLLGAWQMQQLLHRVGMVFGFAQVMAVNLAAAFYELFLPARLGGGVIRLCKFSNAEHHWSQALAAIVFNRFLDTLTLVGLGLVFWAMGRSGAAHWAIGSALAALLAGLLAFHAGVKHPALWSPLGRWPMVRALWAALPAALRRVIDQSVGRTAQAYRRYRLGHASIVGMAGLSVVRHLLVIAAYVWLGRAIGVDVSWLSLGWIRTVVVLLTMLPISIAGFGIREGSLVVLLAPLGVSASGAVALSLLIFATGLVFSLVGGAVELAYVLQLGRGPRRRVRTVVP